MLDEYGLRLLAEIGVDVYLPRAAARVQPASDATAPAPAPALSDATSRQGADAPTDILIIGHESAPTRFLADLQRACRLAGLAVQTSHADVGAIADARGLIVLGERLARDLGAALPAQRQNEIAWVVAGAAPTLVGEAAAKQALWGEIKRLARQFPRARHPD
ncbi:hypothetical protein [Dokdonella immobilis]|uniref:Uncharacterized protein n=1 Tax=Dokdonella immobilis TaxID=578942 RepID=A0A1I4W6X1_9GAMM|nr:hypothetical protein [Dokdonella immobilis]SFN09464.1 hypothetical protein SAMN05216289_10459 [Dokdonella immobilis]